MPFSRHIQWYHSHADPIWPDGTFKQFYEPHVLLLVSEEWTIQICIDPHLLQDRRGNIVLENAHSFFLL
jgi:hypothetical protein